MNSEVIAEIYRSGGELLSDESELLKAMIGRYRALLKKAGVEVAADLQLSPGTARALEEALISDNLYIRRANQRFQRLLTNSDRIDPDMP